MLRPARALAAGFALATLAACGASASAAPAARPSSSGPTPRPSAAAPPAAPPVPLERVVGQLVMAGMTGTAPDADLLQRVRDGQVGGVIVFGENVGPGLADALASLQHAAAAGGSPPLLVSTDQEGGSVRRLPGPPDSPRSVAGADEARRQGEAAGALLASRGIDVDLAPIADVSQPGVGFEAAQGRGFPGGPEQVAALAAAFAEGLQARGVAATAKHFPGIGSLAQDTDARAGVVSMTRERLDSELLPFRRLIEAGVSLVMIANAIYPVLDAGRPALFSPAVMRDLLRGQLGFQGVAITDDLDSASSLAGDAGSRAVAAVAAGADIVLFRVPRDGPLAARALLAAVRDGRLPEATVQAAYARVLALKRRLGPGA
ncbi:MAG TPA: glycoside hydrolase family 3 N-terminal domain-containing protein [Candidatus Dormibacteraeota bacterium]|nr:glycoside hydrolase family 3 N-terminal domain-containing protein [Candidatus Dormibacteraeota bacterium]